MMQRTRVVTVAGDANREASVAGDLSRNPRFELVLRCLDRSELLAAVRGARIDLVLVVGAPAWLDQQVVAEARERSSRIVGFASDPLEAEVFRRLAVQIADPGLELEPLLDTEPQPGPMASSYSDRGRVVTVWGPKGAPGRTTVAIELACEIAKREPRTALVDADTYGGDISQMLAVIEEMPTIVWAAQVASQDRLDEATLLSSLRRTGADGPVLLPGLNRPELWSDISTFGAARLMDVFATSFAFTILDVGFGIELEERLQVDRDRLARQMIGISDHTVAVCRADPVGVKTFLWSMERLKEIKDLDEILIVANRVTPGEADEVGYVLKKHLGKRPLVYLPDRQGETRAALDQGISIGELKQSGEISGAVRDVAAALGAKIPPRGLLTRLAGRA